MRKEEIIKLENVSKTFKLPHEKMSTVKQHFVNIFNRKSIENFKALDNVSFEVNKGDFFGIIGANGSGKSTLLKILAQIYQPTSGKVTINGSLSPFIELGVGFNPELTARENIFLNAAILGLSRKQTEQKFEEIVSFSELENFLDQKLKNFSSGMQVRLAFSMAIQANADILLIDEVLAVGDARFQEKCLDVFRQLKNEGKTIVFVSHDLGVVESFCDRVMFLKDGKLEMIGSPEEVIVNYLIPGKGDEKEQKSKIKDLRIKSVKTFNTDEEPSSTFETDTFFKLKVYFEAEKPVIDPVVGVSIQTKDGTNIFGPNTKVENFRIEKIFGKGIVEYKIKNLPLLSGIYYVNVGIFSQNLDVVYDFLEKAASFRVQSSRSFGQGLVTISGDWLLSNEG